MIHQQKKKQIIFFQISTLDETGIYNLAKRENVNIVITACTDQALLTAANVSEKLRLPFYLSGKIAQNVTNKFDMKQKFKENTYTISRLQSFGNMRWKKNGSFRFL